MLIARVLLASAAIVPCAFALENSATPAPAPARTPMVLSHLEELKPGPLTKSNCETPEKTTPCVAVPIAVTGTNEFGETETVVTSYPVGPDLVDHVKSDFQAAADVVLRNIRPALQVGAKAKDHATRLASKQSIAEVDGTVKYRVASGVKLPLKVEQTVAEIAREASARTGKPMVVTSAARTPTTQAEAMRNKIAMGDNIVKLYANKEAAKSVLYAYKQAKRSGGSKHQVVAKMANVIKAQVDKGVYLSNHLRQGAVDIRTRDLSGWQRKQLVAAVQDAPGVRKTILESIPPHLHVEIERDAPVAIMAP